MSVNYLLNQIIQKTFIKESVSHWTIYSKGTKQTAFIYESLKYPLKNTTPDVVLLWWSKCRHRNWQYCVWNVCYSILTYCLLICCIKATSWKQYSLNILTHYKANGHRDVSKPNSYRYQTLIKTSSQYKQYTVAPMCEAFNSDI